MTLAAASPESREAAAQARETLGLALMLSGGRVRGAALVEEASDRAGLAHHASFALAWLGATAFASGNAHHAEDLLRRAVTAAEAARAPWFVAHVRVQLVRVCQAIGDSDTAKTLYLGRPAVVRGGDPAGTGTVAGLSRAPTPNRFLVGLAVLTLLADATRDGPLLIAIDDAHLLDRESAEVLAFAARRLHTDPIAFVIALGEPAAGDAPFAGLPARYLADPPERPVPDPAVCTLPSQPCPVTRWLAERFRGRVEALPAAAQTLLLLAAAEPSGRAVVLWRAADRLGLSAEAAVAAEGEGLLLIGDRVTFRHPVIRSTIYHGAAPRERERAHAVLAAAAQAQPEADKQVGWGRIAPAALGSPRRRRALAAMPYVGLGGARQGWGRHQPEVERAGRAGPPVGHSSAMPAGLLLDGLAVRLTDGYPAAVPVLGAAFAALLDEPAMPDEAGYGLFAVACLAADDLLDDAAQSALAGRWVRAERDRGNLSTLPVSLSFLAGAEVLAGRLGSAEACLAEACEISAITGARTAEAASLAELTVLAWRGREEEARSAAAGIRHGSLDRGPGLAAAVAPSALAVLELASGRYQAALDCALDVHRDDPPGLGTHVLPDLVEAASRAGDRAAAGAALDRLTERALASGTPMALGLPARCRVLLADDNAAGQPLPGGRRAPEADDSRPTAGPCLPAARRVASAPAPSARRPGAAACRRRDVRGDGHGGVRATSPGGAARDRRTGHQAHGLRGRPTHRPGVPDRAAGGGRIDQP